MLRHLYVALVRLHPEGLTGLYAIQTEGWSSTYNDDSTRPTLDEIFDRIGLKLVRRKAPVNILVVERVEKPSEN